MKSAYGSVQDIGSPKKDMSRKTEKTKQGKNVRALALQVVIQTLEEKQYCDQALHQVLAENMDLSRQDRAFLTRLSEGTVERCLELDEWISQYSHVPLRKMKPVIRGILRMAVYQFRYMDQVPNHAACDEAVRLVMKRRMQGLKGFVNGVLRNIERHLDELAFPDRGNFEEYAHVRYSMPQWIVRYLLQEYPQDQAEEILQSYLDRNHSVCVRCNMYLGRSDDPGPASAESGTEPSGSADAKGGTECPGVASTESGTEPLRSTGAERGTEYPRVASTESGTEENSGEGSVGRIQAVRESLERQGVRVKDGYLFQEALYIDGYDRLEELSVFRQGWIQVQAESSMVVGMVSGIRPGQTVIDVCAAPGGKTVHAADLLRGQGTLKSCDLSDRKVQLIRENLNRTEAESVTLYVQDARKLREDWIETADVLIADLPCSGLGVLGRKCDIKYHTDWKDVLSLAALQREILRTVSRYVKPGGILLYSTCTIGSAENQDNVAWIQEHLPFQPESIEKCLPGKLQGRTGKEGYLQILPTDHTDGFFIAKFRRNVEEINGGKDRY